MTTKTCLDCGNDFFYNPPANYPDTRKYCDDCSPKRKASYEAAQKQKPFGKDLLKPGKTLAFQGDKIIEVHAPAGGSTSPKVDSSPLQNTEKGTTQERAQEELKTGWKNETLCKNINENPDSLTIGTPGKGGEIKCYGDYNEPEAFIVKFTNAKRVRDEAKKIFTEKFK